ncbi:MAG: polyamine ABC transporter ATP-binding protein [Candidatus Rokuibacteriota bacterium]|nr:MAG: polyamine ABC transporter ATP-binding protein [Candidatus Rokubacteria bacterium]
MAGRPVESRHGAEVRLVGLSRNYGEVAAVRAVDLTIAPGEFVTLLGPSGSGKTTTLMMVAGFVHPTAGDILLDGQSVLAVAAHRRNLGVVFQSYALFPHMSVFDNVAFPLRMRHVDRRDAHRRVETALEMVQLGALGSRRIHELSGGQQQRVALARALVFQPPVLLMDEPLGALDRKLREQMQLEIKRIHRTLGLTVLYVTHDQEEALILSDRIAVMHEGRIHQVGRPADVYERPATWFVADFVGESNALTGRVEEVSSERTVVRLCPGDRLLYGLAGALEAGQSVRVMIRPEALTVGQTGGTDGENRVDGVIEDALYLGQAIRYVVRSGDALTLIARVTRRMGDVDVGVGSGVTVTWSRGSTVLIPDTPPS